MLGVGTANPATAFSQRDILDRYGIDSQRIRSLFLSSHIDKRHLTLSDVEDETQGQLLDKHWPTPARTWTTSGTCAAYRLPDSWYPG